jgi:hypothetical protein
VLGKLIDLWPSVVAGMVGGFFFWFLTWLCSWIATEWAEKRDTDIRATRARLAAKIGLDDVRRAPTPPLDEDSQEPLEFTPSSPERDS